MIPPVHDPIFHDLVGLLRHRARTEPGRRAYVFLGDGETEAAELTYGRLDGRAAEIAAALRAAAAPGDRVLLLYPPGLEFLAGFFGCLYAGMIAVPSYPPKRNRADERLEAIAADSGARLALTSRAVLAEIGARLENTPALKALSWIASDALEGALPPEAAGREPRPSDLAFLQYTSGSTSAPKGVMVSHGNLLATLEDLDRGWDHTRDSVMVTWLPIFHDMGLVYGALMPLYRGFPCVMLPPAAFLQRPQCWLRAISHYRGTHSAAPNFAYDLCAASIAPEQRAEFDLRCWHFSLNAAEPVRAETLAAFNETFGPCGLSPLTVSPGYGLAEATLKVSALPRAERTRVCHLAADGLARNRVEPGEAGAPGVQPIVGCGWGQTGNRYVIVDPEARRACPPEAVGEIWFAGPSVAQGYWQRPEETAEVFGARLADAPDRGPFLRTGDLGFVRGDELYVTGRLKDVVIVRGLNHYPQDIEVTVERADPALRPGAGAAFAIEAGGREALVVAQEVKRTHLRKLDVADVVARIRQAVAERHDLQVHAVALLRTGSIPKTSSGKIRRRACRALFLDGQLELAGLWREADRSPEPAADGPAGAAAEATLERAVVETWLRHRIAHRLRVPEAQIDPQEPFSRYGLDSLAAVEIAGALEKWLGRRLAPTTLYDFPTARLLAAHLTAVATGGAEGDSPPPPAGGPVAVIGLGCRFPGADSPNAFWRLLENGDDAISAPPAARGAARWGGFLAGIDGFDSDFFGIAPREADLMDPQQRLLLEVAWEALEDAGIAAPAIAGSRTGVFIGISTNDYGRLLAGRPAASEARAGTGNALSIAANRLSYWLDLRGPSWAVDTACSSSLVAVHQACRGLRSGECALAIAGGVNLVLASELTDGFAKAGMLAADGRCKTFDAAADGYARGEGCGLVVLKRLADAQRDGDRILAVIRGSAVNQDGRSNGLTAPNGPAQRAVVRAALRDADLVPSALSCIEAHGTGTALGDPIEVNALKEVLLEGRDPAQTCWLGSVKTNVGHLEAAAGIAGLIKLVLALRHRKLPPHLHFKTLNPLIRLEGTPLRIPTELTDWPAPGGGRFAGVSSFGFGGTNAHVIVGEAPAPEPAVEADRGGEVLVLSAKTPAALRQLAGRYERHLGAADAAGWAQVCHTAACGRTPLPHRLAVAAANRAEAAERLAGWAAGEAPPAVWTGEAADAPRIAFLYPGQGSVYPGMGLDLRERSSEYRTAFDECAVVVRARAGWNLVEAVESAEMLARTDIGQVALFAVGHALTRAWAAWGVIPCAVAGHSVGEFAAACAAGAMTAQTAVELLLERGRLMAALGDDGAMAAVAAAESDLAGICARHSLEIAAVNSPRETVLTGERRAIRAAADELRAAGVPAQLLDVRQAFHSRRMEPILPDFRRAAERAGFGRTRLPFVSTVTGEICETPTADHWVRQVREPVRFASALRGLERERIDLAIEAGPRGILTALASASWKAGAVETLLSLRPGRGEGAQMLESAGRAWVRGAPIAWRRCAGERAPARCALPLYPFERRRHWCDEPLAARDWDDGALAALEAELASDPAVSAADREAAPRILRALARRRQAGAAAEALRDCLYSLRWIPGSPGPAAARATGPWLLVGALSPVSAALTSELRRRGVSAQVADAYVPGDWSGVALLAESDSSAEEGAVRLLELAKARRAAGSAARLWIVTQGAMAAAPGDAPGLTLAQAPLWGFGRVLALEDSAGWGGMIDLPRSPGTAEIAALADQWLAPDGEDQVALRADGRRVLRLERMEAPAPAGPPLRPDAAYWITGGLGGLGLQVAEWLARHGARQLVLTGRRAPSPAAERAIDSLRAAGTRVLTLRADVAEAAEVRAVLDEAERSLGPVRGIVHAAGVARFDLLPDLGPAELAAVLRPKLAGAAALDAATRGRELDFLVFFSSIAAVWGSKGQAHYAAGNQFLDTLAGERRARGEPALSVNWGPWEGPGMAAGAEAEWLRRSGLSPLAAEDALDALGRLLGGHAGQAVVARVNWPIFRELYELRGRRPLLDALDRGEAAEAALPTAPASAVAQLADAPASERDARLLALLQAEAGAVLGHPPGRLPDPRRGFFELGMDSLLAVEFSHRLARAFARRLPATLAFDHSNLQALAEHFAAEVLGWRPAAAAGAALDPALASRLERLEKLVRGG